MPILAKIKFTHYSPKDSEDGIKEFVIAADAAQVEAYVDETYLYGWLADGLDPEDEEGAAGSFSPTVQWQKEHKGWKKSAKEAGLAVDKYGTVEGTEVAIAKWLRGNWFRDTSDAYYGVTHYDWSEQWTITDGTDIATLMSLRMATDIREEKAGA